MELEIIEQLVNNLSWEKSQEIQNDAILKLSQINEDKVPVIIQFIKKSTWENAVSVLKNIGYPKNKSAITKLIWLLQDMNWPGAINAIEVLSDMDNNIVIHYIEDSLLKAAEEEDYMWIGGIKRLVDKCKLAEKDFLNKDIYDLLKLADW